MPLETELKLRVPPAAYSAVRRHPLLRGAERPDLTRLHATYYDTPGLDLHARGVALRVRREGGRWIQTVKSEGSVSAGLHRRLELATELPGPEPDPARILDPELEPVRAVLNGTPLRPLFETVFTRSRRIVRAGAALIEVSVDRGVARAGARATPFCELELELKQGPVAPLYELALKLVEDVPVAVERRSKAERGYALHGVGLAAPARALRTRLTAQMSVSRALAAVAADALAQVEANEEGVLATEDPEYVHQMRVGVRRLRSALAVFAPALPAGAARPLAEALKWLADALGPARDWDVLAVESLAAAARTFDAQPGWASLTLHCTEQREAARRKAREALTSDHYTRLLLSAAAWIAGESGSAGAGAAVLNAPVGDYAREELERRYRRARRRARELDTQSAEALHRLRIALKKLRYAVEFFGSLFEPDAVKAFRARVTALQDLLGQLNDATTARRLLGAPGQDESDAGVAHARGVLLGWIAGRSDTLRGELRPAWKALRRTDSFW